MRCYCEGLSLYRWRAGVRISFLFIIFYEQFGLLLKAQSTLHPRLYGASRSPLVPRANSVGDLANAPEEKSAASVPYVGEGGGGALSPPRGG